MKEQIKKFAELQNQAIELLKQEKTKETIEKMAEIQKEISNFSVEIEKKEAEEIQKKESEEKEDIKKEVEEIKKWVSMQISTETMENFIKEFNDMKEKLWNITSQVDMISKTTNTSRQEEIQKKDNQDFWAWVLD